MKLISLLTDRINVRAFSQLSNRKGYVMMSLLAVGMCLGTTDRASARDVCKNVNITIQNGTSDTIKVTKFEYFDFDKNKYRTENLLGANGQEKLNPGKSFSTTRNLGQVGNDKTKFRVTYRHQQGGTKFENPVSVSTESFTCTNDSSHPVVLDK